MKLQQHNLVYEVPRLGRQGKHAPGTCPPPPPPFGCLTSGDLSPETVVIAFHANTTKVPSGDLLLLHEQDRLDSGLSSDPITSERKSSFCQVLTMQ